MRPIELLGDEDILKQSAPVLGLYFFVQGRFKEAEHHLEQAVRRANPCETGDLPPGRLHTLFLLGACMVHLGHFHDAVGYFECMRRIGRRFSQAAFAATSQAYLGEVLQMSNKGTEASRQFDSAIKLAEKTDNVMAKSIVKLCLSYQKLLLGDSKAAAEIYKEIIENKEFNPATLTNVPYLQHMLIELQHASGFMSPKYYIESMVSWTTKGANVYLKGVVYRLMADEVMKKDHDTARACSYLEQSEVFLEQTGDPFQLSKTRIEMARLALKQKQPARTRLLAKKAYEGFPRPARDIYPEDLRSLLKKGHGKTTRDHSYKDFLDRFLMIFNSQRSNSNIDDILKLTVQFCCRLFHAERGVFCSGLKRPKKAVILYFGSGEILLPWIWTNRTLLKAEH